MALYSDNFQGYAVGSFSPFGSLIQTAGPAHSSVIANGALLDGLIGPYGQDRYLQSSNCTLTFNDGIARAAGSMFAALRFPGSSGFFNLRLFQFFSSVAGFPLMNLQVNVDGTLVATDASGTPLQGCADFALHPNVWHFIQFNGSFSSDATFLRCAWEIVVDGQTVDSGSVKTRFTYAGLAPFGPFVLLSNAGWDLSNLVFDVYQPVGTIPNPGSPIARISNQVIELITTPVVLAVSCALGTGTVGVPYDSFVVGTGGTGPYTYAVTSGGLPTGLSLNAATGEISGTPTVAGTYPYRIQVTDSLSATAHSDCQIVISGQTNLTLNKVVSGGTATPDFWEVRADGTAGSISGPGTATGDLPAGAYTLSETAGVPGYTAGAWMCDGGSLVGDVLTIPDGLTVICSITNTAIIDPLTLLCAPGIVLKDVAFSAFLVVSGGVGPYTFAIISGSLPPGLSLNTSTGEISGTTSDTTPLNYVAQVTDSLGTTAVTGSCTIGRCQALRSLLP